MAMIAGSVTAGGAGTGLAKEMFDDYIPKLGNLGLPPGSTVASQQVADLCNSFAQTIVAHIQANATVATTVAVVSVSGVTTGGGVSGSGTGTGSGGVT